MTDEHAVPVERTVYVMALFLALSVVLTVFGAMS
jgi:hypothetical protein